MRAAVVVRAPRKAAMLEPFVAHVGLVGPDVQLVVLLAARSGKQAAKDMRKLARRYGVSVRCVSVRRGARVEPLVLAASRATVFIKVTPQTRFVSGFFRALARTDAPAAVRLRQVLPPSDTLRSGWRSLGAMYGDMWVSLRKPRASAAGLTTGVAMTRAALREKSVSVVVQKFELLGYRDESPRPVTFSGVAAWPLALVGVTLLVFAPLVYAAALAALTMISWVLILQYIGWTRPQKVSLALLAPYFVASEPFVRAIATLHRRER